MAAAGLLRRRLGPDRVPFISKRAFWSPRGGRGRLKSGLAAAGGAILCKRPAGRQRDGRTGTLNCGCREQYNLSWRRRRRRRASSLMGFCHLNPPPVGPNEPLPLGQILDSSRPNESKWGRLSARQQWAPKVGDKMAAHNLVWPAHFRRRERRARILRASLGGDF